MTGTDLYFTTALNDIIQQYFTFKVQDDGGVENGGDDESLNATVTITITPVNDTPTVDDQSITVIEDVEYIITLTGDDGDADADQSLTYFVTSLPAVGTLSLSSGGATLSGADLPAEVTGTDVYFTTALNDVNEQSFTFKVEDDGGVENGGDDESDLDGTITLTILPVNDTPTVDDQSITAIEDVEYIVTLTGDDGDVDADQSLT